MLKLAKYLYHNTWIGKTLVDSVLELYQYYRTHFISDEKFLKQNFQRRFGRTLDLENPLTLNEKINWLKLHDRTDLHTQCADKYLVRDYVSSVIGEQYLIPLVFQSYSVDDLKSEDLPDYPFIIKANHDSSGGMIIKDKSSHNWKTIRKHFRKLLKKNYYYSGKEWQYKHIRPCVIAEQLLLSSSGVVPFDYKLHCFNGQVHIIQVDIDRYTNHKRNLYDKEWNLLPFTWSLWAIGEPLWSQGREIEPPKNLTEMITVAEKLARKFCYVRIDLYDFEDNVYFGEITFHHGSGLETIDPESYDLELGQLIDLNPIKNSSAQ